MSQCRTEVPELDFYPCLTYLIIGAEVKGSDIFLVLLKERTGRECRDNRLPFLLILSPLPTLFLPAPGSVAHSLRPHLGH